MKKFISSLLLVLFVASICITPASAGNLFNYNANDIAEIEAYSDIGGTLTKTFTPEENPIKVGQIIDKLNLFDYYITGKYASDEAKPNIVDGHGGYITFTITHKNGIKDVLVVENEQENGALYLPNVDGGTVYIGDIGAFNNDWLISKESPFTSAYTDLTRAWQEAGVEFVYQRDLIDGISETVFSPNKPMDRAAVVLALWRYEINRDRSPTAPVGDMFTDMPSDEEVCNAINWAAENDIVNGYADGSFRPTQTVTREQFATILYRYLHGYRGRTPTGGDISKFTDAGKVSSYALEAVKWAVGEGVIYGTPDMRLNPQSPVTRAEAAAMMSRRSMWN